jgi:hypothetical protein
MWSGIMRVWNELREVVWLASVVWGLSIVGVGLAIALALALDAWATAIPPGVAHFWVFFQRLEHADRLHCG